MGQTARARLAYGWNLGRDADVTGQPWSAPDGDDDEGPAAIAHALDCYPMASEDASCLVYLRGSGHDESDDPETLIVHRASIAASDWDGTRAFDQHAATGTLHDELVDEARRIGMDVDALGEPSWLLSASFG